MILKKLRLTDEGRAAFQKYRQSMTIVEALVEMPIVRAIKAFRLMFVGKHEKTTMYPPKAHYRTMAEFSTRH